VGSPPPSTPEEDYHATDLLARFHEAVTDLPGNMREVFGAVDLEGVSIAAVARKLRVGPKAVEKKLTKARKQILARLLSAPGN